MAKKKLKDFFKYYSSPYAFLSLFKDDKAHIKKVVLAFWMRWKGFRSL